jgi:hypothetical protein
MIRSNFDWFISQVASPLTSEGTAPNDNSLRCTDSFRETFVHDLPCPVHSDVPTNFFRISSCFQSPCNNSTLTLTGNCFACAREVHNCASIPVIQTHSVIGKLIFFLFAYSIISFSAWILYKIQPSPVIYSAANKRSVRIESLNILQPNVCILAVLEVGCIQSRWQEGVHIWT